MEIGHQHVDGPEAVAGRDEDVGRAGPAAQRAVLARGALEQPQRGRADRDDAAAARLAPRSARRPSPALTDAALGMHLVVGGVVGLDRQERPCPDMQRHEVALDAAWRRARRNSSGVKCRPAVGAATAPSSRGIDGLVVAAVALVVRRASRRCRAAAACGRPRAAPRRGTRPTDRSASSTSPPSPFSSTVASSWPRKQALPSWPKRMRSPTARRLPGRAKASQRSGATRMCSVASTCADAVAAPAHRRSAAPE